MNDEQIYHIKLAEAYNAIRKHRDSWMSGDDKCWKDNEELYKVLPEGFSPPQRDTFCELRNCIAYVESCHHPLVVYTSPQRRIEALELKVAKLREQIKGHCERIAKQSELLTRRAEK